MPTAAAIRQRRHRRHTHGDHSLCLPERRCPASTPSLRSRSATVKAPRFRRSEPRRAVAEPKSCTDCSTGLVEAGSPARRCTACRERNEAQRNRRPKRVVRCAGPCGRLIGGGPTSLPAGQRMCRECRLGARHAERVSPRPAIGCANPACQRTIERPTPTQKWCSQACRERSPAAQARWTRKNRKRRPTHRDGGAWQRLRRQVLVEEDHCWVCGDEIDPTVQWPHPQAGTADHVVPLEGGGALLDRGNVRAAHNECNRGRHVEWRRARRAAIRAA